MLDIIQIPCPECTTPISVEMMSLIGGSKFMCKCCNISIQLSSESSPVVENTYKTLLELKNKSR